MHIVDRSARVSADAQDDTSSVHARKRAVIYCRVSTDKQERDGESLDYQEEKCRQYAGLHDIDVILVLHESKSGFIHYSLREKLTVARQMIRDHLADVIIVFDLRRFARNFVHSAMIFEEIESNGGEIVSVSENIDNSLTGKLIRSILAWSAESEREKIVEYANRHWQTRLAHDLPLATGRAPYGWEWADKEKTAYAVNREEATLRRSLFHLFVELDMSLRGIAHKLTEDGVLPPAAARGWKTRTVAWQPSTVHKLLRDTENIGVLRICKSTKALTARGTETRKPNGNMKLLPGAIPPLVPIELYERAQLKLRSNRADKSHRHRVPEDFLLKGHIFCKVCGYRMSGGYKVHEYDRQAYYRCCKASNKYYACPELTEITASKLDAVVWAECCRVFERLDLIRETIEGSIKQSLQTMLEDTRGEQLVTQLEQELAFVRTERAKYPEGSYYYNLIGQDVRMKEERLKRYVEEYSASRDMESLVGHYRSSILNFLNFLNVMQGRYAEATFQEKRNALEVLGVHVDVRPTPVAKPQVAFVETEKEWLSLTEAAQLSGVSEKIIWHRAGKGEFATSKREESRRCTFVHRDEFNRFLATLTIRPRQGRDDVTSRVEISYSPMFAGVQSSLHENYQPVGAFKVRGGINYLSQLPAEARMRGVITASTGNHGQSIAYAARLFGVPARIVVPERSNPGKVAAIEGMGAKIIVHGSTFDEARLHCEALAQSEGYRYIHSANEPLLIAGVATGPLEMLEDEPDLDALIVPIGGGSGAAGACIVAQAINPAIEVIGVQAAASAAAYESWRARRLVEAANQTFAEGLATGVGFTMTQSILQEGLRDFVLVEEEEILQAMVWMIEYAHTLAEGAGASPLAAAYRLRERLQGKKVGLVCSGGNTSLAHLERALAASRSTKQA